MSTRGGGSNCNNGGNRIHQQPHTAAAGVGLAPFVASVEGLALDRINDVLDFEVEHILYDRSTRRQHYSVLEYFWRMHPSRGIEYGRRYGLLSLAKVLVEVCGQPPYNDYKDKEEFLFRPLVVLSREDWKGIQNNLEKLKDILMRKDATVNYSSINDVEDDGDEINLKVAGSRAFGSKFDKVVRNLQIHASLAPIRKKIDDAIAADLKNFSALIGQDELDEIFAHLKTLDDDYVDGAVQSLFMDSSSSEGEDDKEKPRKSFVGDVELIAKMQRKPFDLVAFQWSFERLILSIYNEVYPEGDTSILMKKRYTVKEGSLLARVLAVKPGMQRLTIMEQDAVDNSTDSGFTVRERQGKRGQKRKLGLKTVGERELDEEDEDMQSTVRLTPVKRPKIQLALPSRTTLDVPLNPAIINIQKPVFQRNRWTDEEKQAVIEGVRLYGEGHWAVIKKAFGQVLCNRTGLQIKDCWRTITRKRESQGARGGEVSSQQTGRPIGNGEGSPSPVYHRNGGGQLDPPDIQRYDPSSSDIQNRVNILL